GLDVELGEGGLAALEFIGQRVAACFGAVAHHVGEISRLLRSGHVSPVASCFRYAEFGVIARERQYGGWRSPGAAQRFRNRASRDSGGALQNRGPCLRPEWVPALRSSVKNAAPRPGHGALSSRRAVLFVLCLDRVARLVPVGVAPVAQLIEIAAHGERLRAVH